MINQEEADQKIIQFAAIGDGIQYLSAMAESGFAKVQLMEGKTLHFSVLNNGVNALLGIAFDSSKNPVIATSKLNRLRWFSCLNWECLLVYKDKIIFQGPLIIVDESSSVQCFSIELPVSEKIAKILAKNKTISIGHDAEIEGQIIIKNDCLVHNLIAAVLS